MCKTQRGHRGVNRKKKIKEEEEDEHLLVGGVAASSVTDVRTKGLVEL